MTKEDARENIYTVQCDLGIFVPHINYTPQGILIKVGKKDRLIDDSLFQLTCTSTPYNAFTNKKAEPRYTFGSAFLALLSDIYNLCISFPNQEVYLYADNVTGAFRLAKLHPDVVGGKAIQLGNHCHFPVGQTFGDSTSPPNLIPLLGQHAKYPNTSFWYQTRSPNSTISWNMSQ